VVVVVGGTVVAVVAKVCAAGLAAGRSFFDSASGARVRSMPDPAVLMSATPRTTVAAIAENRPNLHTHRGIGGWVGRLEAYGARVGSVPFEGHRSNPCTSADADGYS